MSFANTTSARARSVICSTACHYDPATRRFVCEASSIGLTPGEFPLRMTIVSKKTGARVVFAYQNTEYHGEDLACVRYTSTECGGMELRVLND